MLKKLFETLNPICKIFLVIVKKKSRSKKNICPRNIFTEQTDWIFVSFMKHLEQEQFNFFSSFPRIFYLRFTLR